MSLGVHYEIMLRNDCLRTDEEQLSLINNRNNNTAAPPKVLNCSYSENFTLALRMSHKPLSRGTSVVSSFTYFLTHKPVFLAKNFTYF